MHNVHAQTEADPEKIRALLVEQIYSPVKWTGCVQAIVASGASRARSRGDIFDNRAACCNVGPQERGMDVS